MSVGASSATVALGPDRPDEPDMVATDVRVALPPVGEPRFEAGIFGIAWIVQHDDGTVSVLDAVVDRRADEDEGGVSGLGTLVVAADDGSAFAATYIWDAHGRTVNGPRSNDLGGFVGVVDGDEVEIFTTPTNAIDGAPDDVAATSFRNDTTATLTLLDLDVLPTLSYSGPIWRLLDATLVVEGGIGAICDIAPASVDQLATCDDGLATTITSSRPEITSWFLSPILVEFAEFGEIVTVVPVGGQASRNDGPDGAASPVSGDGWRLLPTTTVDEQPTPRMIVDDRQVGAPDVDYERSVVLVIDIGGDDCRPDLLNVIIDPDHVRPIFESGGPECGESVVIYRYLIEIDRALLGPVVVVEAPETIGGPPIRTELPVVGGLVDPVPRGDPLSITIPTCPGRNPTELVVILLAERDMDVDVVVAAGGTDVGSTRAALTDGASIEVTVPITNATLGVDVVVVREQNTDEIVAAQPTDSCG